MASTVTFSIEPGELVALIGQNGAGKTTVTKLVNGLLRPQDGDVLIMDLHQTKKISEIARYVVRCSILIIKFAKTVLEEVALVLNSKASLQRSRRACA